MILARPVALMRRNVNAYARHRLMLASGGLEPLLYLAGIGLGVGALVGEVTTDTGTTVPYAVFVAPALLATSVMNGAVIDTTFAVFYRLRFARLYDSVLATPLGPADVARGELGWAMVRGLLYAVSFLVVLGVAGLLRSWWAVLALPAALGVGWAFAGLGLAVVTWLRTWQDTQVVQTALLPVFLFSATFFPAATYPESVRWLLWASPLYHGNELVRALCLGEVDRPAVLAAHAAVLAALGLAGLLIAERRLARLLLR
ncbi:MAG: ABC transporter permease [Actinomycetales bacterium]